MAEKVMVAMSGGVDSSVAALLLKEQGYEICGVTLKLFHSGDIGMDESDNTCCSLADVEDARRVSYRLGFDHHVFNFAAHFRREVMDRFAQSYAAGETPNPCIDCNRYIKFPMLLQRALLLEQDRIATGHYARVEYDEARGRWLLKKARDRSKDQTYVLYAMTQHELAHTLFPLGGLEKSQVRAMAAKYELTNADKPDSQDICFVKDGDYAGFLEEVMGIASRRGDLLDEAGNVLGTHEGIIHYTIGQRKGLPVQLGKPQYVTRMDPVANTVTIGDQDGLFHHGLIAGDVNLISVEALEQPIQVMVKARYRQPEVPALLYPGKNGTVQVWFEQPQRAITPGQAAVFYDGDVVVGGGTILRACTGQEREVV